MAVTSKSICFVCAFLLCVCHLRYFCSGRDTISAGNWIYDKGDEIVSSGYIFRLGFFTPKGNISKDSRYIGIWHYNSSEAIVWVANREKPIPRNVSGTFGIDLKRGNMEVSDSSNTNTYFRADVENLPKSQYYSRTAKLHDSGNLVLTDDMTGKILWESFKNPTNTFLPGMKMDESLILTSWKSAEDPAPGDFTFQLDIETGGYLIMKYGLFPLWKSGLESNKSFIPKQMSFLASSLLSSTTENTSKRVGSSRLLIQSNGTLQYLSWDFVQMRWLILWSEPNGPCSSYQACRSFGRCNPDPYNHNMRACTCLPGYEPTNEDAWKSGNFANGCKKKSKDCTPGHTSFYKLNVAMVHPNTPVFKEVREDQCNSICREECTCQAFSYKTKYRSSGCWLWFNDLDDIQEGSDSDHVLFFRVDYDHRKSSTLTLRGVIISTTVIFAVALICSITCISYGRVVAKRKGNGNIHVVLHK